MIRYEITKEQINEYIEQHPCCGATKQTLQDLFPDAFKTVLEVGKWYVYPKCPEFITFIKEDFNRYGVGTQGAWFDNSDRIYNSDGYKEATDFEIAQALKKEACKRYKDGDFVHSFVHNKTLKVNNSRSEFDYISRYNKIHFGSDGSDCVVVFENGKWAEIIQTITKSEAEKQLGMKIID